MGAAETTIGALMSGGKVIVHDGFDPAALCRIVAEEPLGWLHVLPGTAETVDYFDAGFFSRMKPTARFINIGRGTSVDEAALVSALEAGTIAGAALDVFDEEVDRLTQERPLVLFCT